MLAGRPGAILAFGILIVAISGLPPFPGFWAKWKLVMTLAASELYVDRDRTHRLAARSGLHVPLVWPDHHISRDEDRAAQPRRPDSGLRDGSVASRQRIPRRRACRPLRSVGVHAACRRTCLVPARAPVRPHAMSGNARSRARRRYLAHPRIVRPQLSVRHYSARGRPRRVDRLPRSHGSPSRLLSAPCHHASVVACAAARDDKPRVHFHLGIDHAVLLFPDLAEA